MNSRFTVSLGLRYDLEIVPIDQTGNYLFSDPSDTRSTRTTSRRGSARPGRSTMPARPSCAAAGACTSRRRRIPTSRRSSRPAPISNSFTGRCFPPTTSIPGPSAGRLPTDPFLVNGPVVNRALLNQLYPAGSTTKNTGTVNFDNPDRHLPYSRQASIGIEKQLAGQHRGQRRLHPLELSRSLHAAGSESRASVTTRPDGHADAHRCRLRVQRGGARARQSRVCDYNALQTSIHKRFSNRLPVPRLVHAVARPTGSLAPPAPPIRSTTQTVDPVTTQAR